MADWRKAFEITMKHEGLWSDNKHDKGGATMMGVTLDTYRTVYGKDKTKEDLKNINLTQVENIYIHLYWNKVKGDLIQDQSIANLLADWAYHSGTTGLKLAQEVLKVEKDGIFGPVTLKAINEHDNKQILFEELKYRRKCQLEALAKTGHNKTFLNGWMNRINSFIYEA